MLLLAICCLLVGNFVHIGGNEGSMKGRKGGGGTLLGVYEKRKHIGGGGYLTLSMVFRS